jgi:hypothetical protein
VIQSEVFDVAGRYHNRLPVNFNDQPSLVVDVARQTDNAAIAGQRGTDARSYGGASRAVVGDQFRRHRACLPPLGDSTAQLIQQLS